MSKKEESRQMLGHRAKKIKDATLHDSNAITKRFKTEDVEVHEPVVVLGDKDAPPMEMTDELLEELVEEEKEKEEKQKGIRSKTQHYTNGKNEWKLIAKTYNNILDWEHVTTAMQMPAGVLICVKEAIGQKMHSTMTYVPGAMLSKVEEKYLIV